MADPNVDIQINNHWADDDQHNAPSSCSERGFFEIHVKGYLSSQWSDWFEGLELELLDNGEMILSGIIVDQAALLGILNKINRLNLTLLSLSEVNPKK